jgi:hypothetical protein
MTLDLSHSPLATVHRALYLGKTKFPLMKWILFFFLACNLPGRSLGQQSSDWHLDKMPADLEKELALRALPPHLRAAATVYLLDPAKGYYVAQKGSNGFICFVTRTDWEWGEFRKDIFAPMAYDAEGARTIFPLYRDPAAMRASGKFTPKQVKDTMVARIHKGIYKAPARGGISYMLAPIMRVYTGKPGDETVMTMNMPHYMFYAPYTTDSDVGTNPNSPKGPWLVNSGDAVLGAGKGFEGYLIFPADEEVKGKILQDGKDLLKRLADYSPYLKVDATAMHH